jgi:hypothetical protein
MILVNILYSFIYCWCTVLIIVTFCLYVCSGMRVVLRVVRVQTVRSTSGIQTHRGAAGPAAVHEPRQVYHGPTRVKAGTYSATVRVIWL